jgi:hypothetical protein
MSEQHEDKHETLLADLLAVIHMDGGAFTREHGYQRSVLEARYRVAAVHLEEAKASKTDAQLIRARMDLMTLRSLCRAVLGEVDTHNKTSGDRFQLVGPGIVSLRRAFYEAPRATTSDGE